jgi:Arc/MetJ-type ribon-helix-helix transcriptional regulator
MTNNKEEGTIRLEITMNKYVALRLDHIMESGLYGSKAEAVKQAIVDLDNDIIAGKFSPEGRKITLK